MLFFKNMVSDAIWGIKILATEEYWSFGLGHSAGQSNTHTSTLPLPLPLGGQVSVCKWGEKFVLRAEEVGIFLFFQTPLYTETVLAQKNIVSLGEYYGFRGSQEWLALSPSQLQLQG